MTRGDREPIVLIVNPGAGRGQGSAAGTIAEATLRGRGVTPQRLETEGPGSATELARKAAADGAGLVVGVGGDGTLHEVLNGLLDPAAAEQAPPDRIPALGAVPVGSGNDYVKMLGIPRAEPRRAAESMLEGSLRTVDVGRLEGAAPRGKPARPELFLNNLGLAFAGVANAKIETTRGLPGGGGIAYLAGSLLAFLSYKPQRYELEADGAGSISGRPTIIHVNLGRYCGGGVLFTPDAELDDGLFDVFYLAELTRPGALLRWHAVTHGAGRTLADTTILKTRTCAVRGAKGFVLHADGEVRVAPEGEVKATVLPRALRVVSRYAPTPAT